MDTQKITARFRLSGWGESVKERIASGQSIKAFCKEKGISQTTYYYRQKKVREAACAEITKAREDENALVPNGWAQLETVDHELSNQGLSVEIGECRIIVEADTDIGLLMKVCRALKTV